MPRRIPLAIQLASVHAAQPDKPCFASARLLRRFGVTRIATAYHALLVARVVRRAGYVNVKGRRLPAFRCVSSHNGEWDDDDTFLM